MVRSVIRVCGLELYICMSPGRCRREHVWGLRQWWPVIALQRCCISNPLDSLRREISASSLLALGVELLMCDRMLPARWTFWGLLRSTCANRNQCVKFTIIESELAIARQNVAHMLNLLDGVLWGACAWTEINVSSLPELRVNLPLYDIVECVNTSEDDT